MYNMRLSEKIFEAIGNVEDNYLEEAEEKSRKKAVIRFAFAACLGILVFSAFVFNRISPVKQTPHNTITELSEASRIKASVIVIDKNTSMRYSQSDDKTYYYTDYTVKVVESFDNRSFVDQILVIRSDNLNETASIDTSESFTDISIGSKLIVLLYQPPQADKTQSSSKNIFYISGNGNGAFLIDGNYAVSVGAGDAYRVEDLIALIQPSSTSK